MDIATDNTITPMIAQDILAGTVVDTAKVMPTDISRRNAATIPICVI